MKRKYRDIKLRPASLALVKQCNVIVAKYQAMNLRLTLRQLYYQLVSANVITNVERSYKNLSSLVSDARLAGLIDWDAIEDRVRVPKRNSEWDTVADLVESACLSYRLPRWAGQDNYVELWVEKDALAGVLQPIASEYHVTLMVNRGYSSQTAMRDSALRFITECDPGLMQKKKAGHLLYLGDHDPSGEDMVRDIRDRLEMFHANVRVQKLALTMAQIRKYKPPPNPAKVTDPRADKYIEEHGDKSWEVDALPPDVLTEIISSELEELCDMDLMQEVKDQEEEHREALRKAAEDL